MLSQNSPLSTAKDPPSTYHLLSSQLVMMETGPTGQHRVQRWCCSQLQLWFALPSFVPHWALRNLWCPDGTAALDCIKTVRQVGLWLKIPMNKERSWCLVDCLKPDFISRCHSCFSQSRWFWPGLSVWGILAEVLWRRQLASWDFWPSPRRLPVSSPLQKYRFIYSLVRVF